MVYAVIIAGGTGERFWPKSRQKLPKQLLSFFDKKTLIEQTIDRISSLIPYKNIYISTNQNLAKIIKKHLHKIPIQNYIIEPLKKNTAPAIALAAHYLIQKDNDATMVILSADHIISENEKFLQSLKLGINSAIKYNSLVVIGIKPKRPAIEYGYIQVDEKISTSLFKIKSFKEKPDKKTATVWSTQKKYYWNSGMFIWKAKAVLDAFKKYLPDMYNEILKITDENIKKEVFEKIQDISIDYGIMEKANNVLVVEGNFKWDDVGSWQALERVFEKNDTGNISIGNILSIDTKNSIIYSDKELIATIGIENLVIVSSENAILVCSKNEVQKVKEIVKILKYKNMKKYL